VDFPWREYASRKRMLSSFRQHSLTPYHYIECASVFNNYNIECDKRLADVQLEGTFVHQTGGL
jgi:hypothetical protein